jgi:predicted nucleic acid-binding protein
MEMVMVKTKQAIFDYLIEPSPLFFKQVLDIAETKAYILVRDFRNIKKLSIPDIVHHKFESRLQHLSQYSYKYQEYDGVQYLLIPKVPSNEAFC